MKVSIIIPNHNGMNLLKKNLPAVSAAIKYYSDNTKNKVEVIVVDDASTDDSVEYLKSQKLPTRLIENDKNLGFALTINTGVRDAAGEIVVLLNSDVRPDKEFLIPLISHFTDKNLFAVGCMDKSIENGKIVLRGRGIGQWKRGFLVHKKGEVDKTDTLWVNGGSGAFRKSIWEDLGGFNELYSPFYWEDIDLSYRALKSGYTILFEPKSTVVHEHEKGAILQKYSLFQIKTIAYRNQFLFVWLNLTDIDLKLKHLLWLPYHFVKAIFRMDYAFLLGFLKAFVYLPKVIYLIDKLQKNFKKKDREVAEYLQA